MKSSGNAGLRGSFPKAAFIALAALLALAPLSAQNVLKPGWEGVAGEIRTLVASSMESDGITGFSLVLVDGGEVVWSEGFGHADVAAGRKADADTMFEIGSVSKTFTGLMVMQLAEQGKIDIDRPVADYIPGFRLGPTVRDLPRNDRPITVRDLMAHHSGLPGDLIDGAFATSYDPDYNSGLLDWLSRDSATYPPGYRWAYSNTAVALLANVIESASGKSFAECSDAFLASMGMAPASFMKGGAELMARLSKAYADGAEFPVSYINIPASGSIVASANQMGRYLRMLLGKGTLDGARIVKPETLAAMLEKQYPGNRLDMGIDQGLSFILSDPELAWAGKLFWHNGATLAFRSHLEVLPGHGLAAFAVTNSAGGGGAVANIAKAALVTALRERRGVAKPGPAAAATPTRVELPARMLEHMAGVFVSDDRGQYDTFRPVGGGFAWTTVKADGAGGVKDQGMLYPWSDGLFRTAADAPDAYEFKEAAGRFVQVIHRGEASSVAGERYAPKPLTGAWKSMLGPWVAIDANRNEIGYTRGEIPEFNLVERDGLLLMDVAGDLFVVDPVSDTAAALAGLGRLGGLSVRPVRGADGSDRLLFKQNTYERKGVDPALAGGPPAALPRLRPVATYGGGRFWRSSVGGYPVLSLKGTWREMGRQYGALLSSELKEFHAAINADLGKRGLDPQVMEMVYSTFQTYTPEMKDLVEGMAETSGLAFADHMLLDASFYLLPGLVIEGLKAPPACSGIAVSGPRTADGKLYFARNWDMTSEAMGPYRKYMALVAFNPTDGALGFANIRPIGQAYVETGINEKGILVELNNGSGSDPGGNPDARFSVASLFDFIRTSDTLDGMILNLTTTKMDSSYIIQAADADRAVSVEIPTFDARVREQEGGALYALNHFARPTYEPWKGKIVELPPNAHDDRQVCLDAIFASPEWQEGVGLDTVKRMMDLTVENGGPVVTGSEFGTVLQVIAVPADLRVLFRGYGYSGWADVDLKALFE